MTHNECAFDNGNRCRALTKKHCEKCSFRKTADELIAGRKRARELIDRLPYEERVMIMAKYYPGESREYDEM